MFILEEDFFHCGGGHTVRVHANIKLVLFNAVEDAWQNLAHVERHRDAELVRYIRLNLVSVYGLLEKSVQLRLVEGLIFKDLNAKTGAIEVFQKEW